MRKAAFALCFLALILPAKRVAAVEDVPGDSCAGITANSFRWAGGPENGGVTHGIFCESNTWLGVITFKSSGYVGIGTTCTGRATRQHQQHDRQHKIRLRLRHRRHGHNLRRLGPDGQHDRQRKGRLRLRLRHHGRDLWRLWPDGQHDRQHKSRLRLRTGTTGITYGVWGRTDSTSNSARGVYGNANGATGATGATYGVYGRTDSTGNSARGVYGNANGGTGITYGVYGTDASATGFGGYFTNTNGGYALATGSGNVGIGTTSPTAALHVVGDIRYTGILADVSDRRAKNNITPLSGQLEKVTQLQAVSFIMKDDPKHSTELVDKT